MKPVKINLHKNQKPFTKSKRVYAALAKLKELQKSNYLPFLKRSAGNCPQKKFLKNGYFALVHSPPVKVKMSAGSIYNVLRLGLPRHGVQRYRLAKCG